MTLILLTCCPLCGHNFSAGVGQQQRNLEAPGAMGRGGLGAKIRSQVLQVCPPRAFSVPCRDFTLYAAPGQARPQQEWTRQLRMDANRCQHVPIFHVSRSVTPALRSVQRVGENSNTAAVMQTAQLCRDRQSRQNRTQTALELTACGQRTAAACEIRGAAGYMGAAAVGVQPWQRHARRNWPAFHRPIWPPWPG